MTTTTTLCDCCGIEPAVVDDYSENTSSRYCLTCDQAGIEADSYGAEAAICVITEAIEGAIRYGYANADDIVVAIHKHLAFLERQKVGSTRSRAQLHAASTRNQQLRQEAAANRKAA